MDDQFPSAHLIETLGRMEGKIDGLVERVSGHAPQLAAHEKRLDDHSVRLGSLERSRWRIAGAAALVGAVTATAGVAAAVAALFF